MMNLNSYPKDWKQIKLRQILRPFSEKNHPDLPLLSVVREKGVIVRNVNDKEENHNYVPEDLSNYKRVNRGQFAMNKMKAWQGSYGISKYDGIVSPAYFVFDVDGDINLDFFNVAIRSQVYVSYFGQASDGIRVGQWDLSMQRMKEIHFLVPPRTEQDQIVQFLDWKVSAINRLIKSYRHGIELISLMEQKIINDYLTHGCRKNRNLKKVTDNVTSRWMSDIPDNWKESKIGRHFVIKKRIAGREGYPVLSITQRGIKEKDIASNEGQMASNYSGYQFVYPGEFAMNHMDLLTGYIGIASQLGVTSPDYRVFALEDTDNCYAPYYLLLFQLCYKRRIFYAHGRGAAAKGRWRFPADNFKRFIIPLPPINEQREIVESIKPIQIKSAKLIANIEKKIETLTELRNRLIADTVTGKIDVRNIEIPEYEFVREESQAEEKFDAEGSDNGE